MISPLIYAEFEKEIHAIVARGETPKTTCPCEQSACWHYEGSIKRLWETHVFCQKCGVQTHLEGDLNAPEL